MDKMNWIKMGCNLTKILVLVIFVIVLNRSSSSHQATRVENFNFNKILGMNANAEKKEEEKPKPVVVEEKKEEKKVSQVNTTSNRLNGVLTGYAADCPLCNGTLACKPKYNVYKNNVVTYSDSTYGNVRIVASSTSMPCGSIVRFQLKSISSEPITAIVLDRGVLGNNLDLLMTTESEASKVVGRRNITYEVLRRGW